MIQFQVRNNLDKMEYYLGPQIGRKPQFRFRFGVENYFGNDTELPDIHHLFIYRPQPKLSFLLGIMLFQEEQRIELLLSYLSCDRRLFECEYG